MISIVPKADLKEDTDYEIQYLGGLQTTDGVYLKANKKTEAVSGTEEGFKTMDATAPEVTEIVSKSGTTAFETSKAHEFIVKFSEPVALDMNPGSVVIAQSSVDLETGSGNGTDSNGKRKVLAHGTDYTVTPVGKDGKEFNVKINAGSLSPDKAYKLRITGKDAKDYAIGGGVANVACDAQSNFMKKTAVYTFSTELDTQAPVLVNVFEGHDITDTSKIVASGTKTNVKAGDEFTFLFDEKLDTTAFSNSNVVVQEYSASGWGGSSVTTQVSPIQNKDNENVAVKVKLGGTFADAKYRIVFTKGAIKDLVPAPDTNVTDEFRYEFVGTFGNDDVQDVNVKASTNKLGDANDTDINAGVVTNNVDVKSRLFVVLDETATTGITAANLTLKDADGNAVEGEVKEVTDSIYSNGKTVYAFIPAKDLNYASVYTLTLKDVKDVVGNTIETKAVSFKTAPDAVRVSSISIEDGAVSVNRIPAITIKFNNEATLTKNTTGTDTAGKILLKEKSGTVNTDYVLTPSSDKKTYTLTFEGVDVDSTPQLKANTQYELIVNIDGITSDNYKKITFQTGYDAKDVVKPALVKEATYGLNNITVDSALVNADAINTVAAGNVIAVEYNEKLDLADATVECVNVADTTKKASLVNKALSTDSKTATFTTVGTELNATYKVTISNIKDKAGNVADSIEFFIKVDSSSASAATAARQAVADYEKTINALDLTDATDLATANNNISTYSTGGTGKGYVAQQAVTALTTVEKSALQDKINAIDKKINDAKKAADDKAIAQSIVDYETALGLLDAEGKTVETGTHTADLSVTISNITAAKLTDSNSKITIASDGDITVAGADAGVFKVDYAYGSGTTVTRYYKVTATDAAKFTVTRATGAEAANARLEDEESAIQTAFTSLSFTESVAGLVWDATGVNFTKSNVATSGNITLPDTVSGKYQISYTVNASSTTATGATALSGNVITPNVADAGKNYAVDYTITSATDSEKTITGTITLTFAS